MSGLVNLLLNKLSATSEMDVNVFYKINPFIYFYCIFVRELIATAPPRLLPKMTNGNFLAFACYSAAFRIATPSFLIPV
jgi:hypothetical protein